MKRNFTGLVLAASAAAALAAPTVNQLVFRGDKMPVLDRGVQFAHVILPGDRQQTAVSRSDESGYNVTVNFDYDKEQYYTQMAILRGPQRYFGFLMSDDPTAVIEGVVPGDYTVIAYFSNTAAVGKPCYNIVIKKITVSADMSVSVSPDEAVNTLRFSSPMPDGAAPVLPVVPSKDSNRPEDYDWTGATAKEVAAYTTVGNDAFGNLMMFATNSMNTSKDGVRSDAWLDIAISDVGDDWHIAQTRYIVGLGDEYYFAHIGVDGSVQPAAVDPDYTLWKYDFADNPIQGILGDDGYPYGVLPVPVLNGEMDPGMWGYAMGEVPVVYLSQPRGCGGPNFTSDYGVMIQRVEVNRQVENQWGYDIDMRGITSPLVHWDSDIQGPAFAVGGAAAYGSAIWWNADDITPGIPGNPVYASPGNGLSMQLGRSVPVAVVTPYISEADGYFDISLDPYYLGMYGEDRGGDGAVSTAYVSVEGQDETVCDCDDLDKTMEELAAAGKLLRPFSVEIANDRNVLVDDVAGYNNTVMSYADPSHGNCYGPTATMLQFRNSAGEITNRFAEPTDGYVLLSGGDFEYDGEGWNCGPVTLKVEWATRAGEEWHEIVMTEEPENRFMPGFGTFWRGSLTGVEGLTRDGWYKMRISMTDADGNSQVQTIYPAFCVEKFAGVESVEATCGVTDAPVEYFNLQGQRVASPSAGQILLRRQGTEVTKMIVR